MRISKAGFALAAALLFGASTPAAKLFVAQVEPQMLAGLLYLGSGLGLAAWLLSRSLFGSNESSRIVWSAGKRQWLFLLGAILFGGIIAPIFLMSGLHRTSASASSLLLNVEGALTATLACWVFHEHYGKRLVLGLVLILSGGAILSWSGEQFKGSWTGVLFIVGACACWAIDNNLTKPVQFLDAPQLATLKGLIAGLVNVLLSLSLGQPLPEAKTLLGVAVIGFFGYGLSLVFFIYSLRRIGTARTSAYFSTAPFVGAILSIVVLREPFESMLLAAGILMAIGVYLHLTEVHAHEHTHESMEHEHVHVHDEHHQHEHSPNDPPGEPHSHWHRHVPLKHSHPHEHDDLHHQHGH